MSNTEFYVVDSMILSDLHGHSKYRKPFRVRFFVHLCRVDEMSTDIARRAVPLRGSWASCIDCVMTWSCAISAMVCCVKSKVCRWHWYWASRSQLRSSSSSSSSSPSSAVGNLTEGNSPRELRNLWANEILLLYCSTATNDVINYRPVIFIFIRHNGRN